MGWSGLAFAVAPYEMVVGPVLAALYSAVRRTRLSVLMALAVVAGAAIWWIDVWLVFANVGDLSGFMDCYGDCSGSQETAGWILFVAPIPMAAIIVALLIASGAGYMRQTRSRSTGLEQT